MLSFILGWKEKKERKSRSVASLFGSKSESIELVNERLMTERVRYFFERPERRNKFTVCIARRDSIRRKHAMNSRDAMKCRQVGFHPSVLRSMYRIYLLGFNAKIILASSWISHFRSDNRRRYVRQIVNLGFQWSFIYPLWRPVISPRG